MHGPDDTVRARGLGLLVQDAEVESEENAEEEEAHVVALLVAAEHVRLLDLAEGLEASELVFALLGEAQLVVAEHAVAVDVGLEVPLKLAGIRSLEMRQLHLVELAVFVEVPSAVLVLGGSDNLDDLVFFLRFRGEAAEHLYRCLALESARGREGERRGAV